MAPAGLSGNSVLVSTYYVLLRLLSEGFGPGKTNGDVGERMKDQGYSTGFLHRFGCTHFQLLHL